MTLVESARSSVSMVTKHADLLLVFAVIAVIALMILPMPTPLVDLLISMNLAVSFLIMMMSLYTPSVLGFAS
ncbi:MAG: FHIPEP family type III secretion protein, partial [Succinivibrio sp.]|nr:FHIPEP family type III secretion protein [Succinivibrio sp.]